LGFRRDLGAGEKYRHLEWLLQFLQNPAGLVREDKLLRAGKISTEVVIEAEIIGRDQQDQPGQNLDGKIDPDGGARDDRGFGQFFHRRCWKI